MATRICLIRHGESEWNRTHRYTGQQDSPLSRRGREQAKRVAERLQREPLSVIYASRLRRAAETAQFSAEAKSLRVIYESAFAEINHGTWEGLTTGEVAARFPNELALWRDEPDVVVMPDGESLEDVRRRAIPVFQQIVQRSRDETIAIFSHDAVQRVILLDSLGIPFRRFWEWRIENASVTVLEYDGATFQLALLNDTDHLEGVCADYDSQAL
jgi:broad specificity phosphatase PhoE